jgi:hypothetical protein
MMMSEKPFGLVDMVKEALPQPVAESAHPSEPKRVSRRWFISNTIRAGLAAQNIPVLLNALMASGGSAIPESVSTTLDQLPQNHPIRLIAKLAKARSNLEVQWRNAVQAAYGKDFALIEDPTQRAALAAQKELDRNQAYADYTAIERELFNNGDSVRAFAEKHFDAISKMPEFRHESQDSWLKHILPNTEESVGKLQREKIVELAGGFANDFERYAQNIKTMREIAGITDPKINPFEAAKGFIDGMQNLVDLYCEHRTQTSAHLDAFKRFVWAQKNLHPLEDTLDVQQEMDSHIKASSRHYNGAITTAETIIRNQRGYTLLKSYTGKIKLDWKRYSHKDIYSELSSLSYDTSGEVIDKLRNEKENLVEQYESAAKDTLLRWKLVEALKDPLTSIERSHSLFKITRKDINESDAEPSAVAQEKLNDLNSTITTLYPEREAKTAKGMLFIDRGRGELDDALETIMERKNAHQHMTR